MKKTSELVKMRLQENGDSNAFDEYKATLQKDRRKALENAERLADRYKDIKPKSLVISGNHLFSIPN